MATELPKGLWKRGDTYYANFKCNGRHVRKKLSTSRRTAERMLTKLRERTNAGDFGLLDEDYPYAELKAEYLRWAKQTLRPDTYESYGRDLRHFEAYMMPASVRQITPEHVVRFRDWRLSTSLDTRTERIVTPRTVNREVGTVHGMLNKGVEWGLIGRNPIATLDPLDHDTPAKERRALTAAECEALFEASPDYLRPVWRMFAVTGLRKSELVELQFSDIDFERRVATVRAANAKSKKAREVPLSDDELAIIERQRDAAKRRQPVKGNTPAMTARQKANFSRSHVFVTAANTPLRNNLLRQFYGCCKRAGIEDAKPGGAVDIHSLRGTFATLSMEHGASPRAVQDILGHSTLAMTMKVYAKATERARRDAVNALPFAKASDPEHVLRMPKRCTPGAQETANVDETPKKLGAQATA